jgi:hypothetical protein
VNDSDGIRRQYRRFAEAECRGYSEAYDRLARAIAGDDEVVGFLAEMPVTQPNLFFASIQFLTGPDRMPGGGHELRTFLGHRGRDVAELMRSRRTQTNEVGRCAALVPALPPGPLALVEVGASAGLCLLFDRFAYRYGSTRLGALSSPVQLSCSLRGAARLPTALPRIVWRRGLDLQPVDVYDEDAVRWLLACVWSDHPERRRRLAGAVELARADPPSVRAGDLVDDLPALLADAPRDASLVVFHSAVLAYVTPERRRAFVDVLADASTRRELVWISNEGPGIVPEITAPAPPSPTLRFLLARTRFANGHRHDQRLALVHPHGNELAWL